MLGKVEGVNRTHSRVSPGWGVGYPLPFMDTLLVSNPASRAGEGGQSYSFVFIQQTGIWYVGNGKFPTMTVTCHTPKGYCTKIQKNPQAGVGWVESRTIFGGIPHSVHAHGCVYGFGKLKKIEIFKESLKTGLRFSFREKNTEKSCLVVFQINQNNKQRNG